MLSQVWFVRQVVKARVYRLANLELGVKFQSERAHRRAQPGERRVIRRRELVQPKQFNKLLDQRRQLIVPCALDRVTHPVALAARLWIDPCDRERIVDLAVGGT